MSPIVYQRAYGETCHGYVVRVRLERFVVVERDGLRVYTIGRSGEEVDADPQPSDAAGIEAAVVAAAAAKNALGYRSLRVARDYVNDVAELFAREALP